MAGRQLRAAQHACGPWGGAEPPPGRPPGRVAGGDLFATRSLIYARKPSHKVRLNASRTSKRRVSCLGTSSRRNGLITLTLLKSGIACEVYYASCFVQPMANTKTCLPIHNYGEYRKAPFFCFRQRRIEQVHKKELKPTANSKRR